MSRLLQVGTAATGPLLTPAEARKATRANTQPALFDLNTDQPCPACGGGTDCTCDETGAEALGLFG